MSARVYFMKMVKDCKDVSLYLRKMNSEDGPLLCFHTRIFLFFFWAPPYDALQTLKNSKLLQTKILRITAFSVDHYTKSKNYLKRRYWIRYWIPMFIGTPCTDDVFDWCRLIILSIGVWKPPEIKRFYWSRGGV